MDNPITGKAITNEDMLLVIGDQTVTIAVLRQQVADARTEIQNIHRQYQGTLKNLHHELESTKTPVNQCCSPDSPFANREYAPGLGASNPNVGIRKCE